MREFEIIIHGAFGWMRTYIPEMYPHYQKARQQSFAQSWTQHAQLCKFHFYVLNFTLAKKLHTL